MAEKKHPLGFTFADGLVIGPLKYGFSIDGVLYKDFELREATVDDLLDAEMEADITRPLNFSAQLMVRQLVKVGKPADWRILRAAQSEVDDMGEVESASEKVS